MEITFSNHKKIVAHPSGRVDEYDVTQLEKQKDIISADLEQTTDNYVRIQFEIAELSKT